MKLSSKLSKGIIILLLVVILISMISTIYLFNNSLKRFVEIERKNLFDQITSDLEDFSRNEQLSPLILENYSINEELLIKYYDINGNLLYEFNGLSKNKNYSNDELVTLKIDLLNPYGINIGVLTIQYLENIFEYDESIKDFQVEIFRNYTFIFLLSLAIGSLFVIILSKRVTGPINDIKNITNQLRLKKYNIEEKNYDIYELDELNSNIKFLADTLKNQDKVRVDYAKDISHELRTPLTNLLLHLEGIKDEVIEADEQTINLLLDETKRLNKMIDNLESSFINNEKILELNINKVNLNELLKNIANSFIPKFNEKNIDFNLELDSVTTINTDANKLTQIISNLITNAIKAVNKNGKIILKHKSFKNREVISVTDNGIGIKKEDIEHIFDRFYRVDNVRNTKVSGHGLGLSITKTYIDLLGYNISVNSDLGKGSEFIITINTKWINKLSKVEFKPIMLI